MNEEADILMTFFSSSSPAVKARWHNHDHWGLGEVILARYDGISWERQIGDPGIAWRWLQTDMLSLKHDLIALVYLVEV